jgi:hypothetical protein
MVLVQVTGIDAGRQQRVMLQVGGLSILGRPRRYFPCAGSQRTSPVKGREFVNIADDKITLLYDTRQQVRSANCVSTSSKGILAMQQTQMLPRNVLVDELTSYRVKHGKLKGHFEAFCKADAYVKGVTAQPELDQNRITFKYCDLMVVAVFTSFMNAGTALTGRVSFYRLQTLPESVLVYLGNFMFNTNGDTAFVEPQTGKTMDMNSYGPYLTLQILHQELFKAEYQ